MSDCFVKLVDAVDCLSKKVELQEKEIKILFDVMDMHSKIHTKIAELFKKIQANGDVDLQTVKVLDERLTKLEEQVRDLYRYN